MGNTRSKLLMLAVASLFFLGAVARADNFSGTAVAASGGNLGGVSFTVDVWYYGTSASYNPFGAVDSDSADNNPFQTGASCIGGATLIQGACGVANTAIFDTSTPGFELEGGTTNGIYIIGQNSGTCPVYSAGPPVVLYSPCGSINTSATPTTQLSVASGAYVFNNAGEFYIGTLCNGTTGPFGTCGTGADEIKLEYVTGQTIGTGPTVAISPSGVFTATDTSGNYIFEIVGSTTTPPPTPEPSSLLMLGSGLLGLFGMGLRRKIEA